MAIDPGDDSSDPSGVTPGLTHPVGNHRDDYLLPCGRRLEDLWERLEAEPGVLDDHERGCPHCRTARESLLALRHATQRLVEEPIDLPVGLSGRIMAAVRAEIRRTTMLPLPTDTAELDGAIEISEQAVAVVVRFAADQVPGVRARRCTVRAQPDAPPGVLTVELAIALRYGTAPADRVLAAIRAAIADAAATTIGVQIAHCGLSIEDIYT